MRHLDSPFFVRFFALELFRFGGFIEDNYVILFLHRVMFDFFFQRHGPWFSQINCFYGGVFFCFSFLLYFFPFSVFFLFPVFVFMLMGMFVIRSCLISLFLFFTLTSTPTPVLFTLLIFRLLLFLVISLPMLFLVFIFLVFFM